MLTLKRPALLYRCFHNACLGVLLLLSASQSTCSKACWLVPLHETQEFCGHTDVR